MLRYTFEGFEIEQHGEDEEHLFQVETDSAYEAVTACLGPKPRADYLKVLYRCNGSTLGEISPYSVWGSRERFEEALRTTILAMKIQLNIELSQDRATEDLIVAVFDKVRLS